MTEENIKKEEFSINGEELLAKVKEIIKEGHARRIIIRNEKGDDLLVIPLTFVAVGRVDRAGFGGCWCVGSAGDEMYDSSRKEVGISNHFGRRCLS